MLPEVDIWVLTVSAVLSRQDQLDPQTEEALVASKMHFLAEEYSQLLVNQLDQQRAYYEGLLHNREEELEALKQQADALRSKCEIAGQQALDSKKRDEKLRQSTESKLVRRSIFHAIKHWPDCHQ